MPLVLGWLSVAACSTPPVAPAGAGPPDSWPAPETVLLVTVEGLRFDAVAGLQPNAQRRSFTPKLDALIEEASWSGRMISASSEASASLASVLTGLAPWHHRVLRPGDGLPAALPTLGEVFTRLGYRTEALFTGSWLPATPSFARGFVEVRPLRGGGRARGLLGQEGAVPLFLWVHLTEPEPPYRLPPPLARQEGELVHLDQLAKQGRDRQPPLTPEQRRRVWRGYLQHVLLLDHQIGDLLAALQASGRWDRSAVIVVSTLGEEFGEQGGLGHGGNLSRTVLEVPAIVKLPASAPALSLAADPRPSTMRLWATLAALAGVEAPLAVGPSLFRNVASGALSEVYFEDGSRQFSLVAEDVQLIREIPKEGARGPAYSAPQARERLLSWEGRSVRPIRAGASQQALSDRLRQAWTRNLDQERSLEEEGRLWAATYR